jgi:hypothetical protein
MVEKQLHYFPAGLWIAASPERPINRLNPAVLRFAISDATLPAINPMPSRQTIYPDDKSACRHAN